MIVRCSDLLPELLQERTAQTSTRRVGPQQEPSRLVDAFGTERLADCPVVLTVFALAEF